MAPHTPDNVPQGGGATQTMHSLNACYFGIQNISITLVCLSAVLALALALILMHFAHEHILPLGSLLRKPHKISLMSFRCNLNLLSTSGSFIPHHHNTFMSEIWAFCLFVMVFPRILFNGGDKKHLRSSECIYREACKTIPPHLFLRERGKKTDRLSNAYLYSFFKSTFHPTCLGFHPLRVEMAHG